MSYRETFPLSASVGDVFAALIEPATLTTWLAEHVRVEPRKGGSYKFWGRDVLWASAEDQVDGEILELDAPHSLVIAWRWQGHTCRVSFDLEANGSATNLSIAQEFQTFDPGPTGPGPDMAGSHWRIAIGNLASVLAGRSAALRPDYLACAAPGRQLVELEIEIEAPPERVFQALLDPAQVRIWMQAEAPHVDINQSTYSFGWTRGEAAEPVGPVRLLELVPNRLLVHDWQWTGEVEGVVRWELQPTATGTRLRLLHSRSADVTHALGWSDALFSIRALVEGGLG